MADISLLTSGAWIDYVQTTKSRNRFAATGFRRQDEARGSGITDRRGWEASVSMMSNLPSRFRFIRNPLSIILGWIALAVLLYFVSPRWEQVTKDDNVRFFPAGSRSVIGQDLLEAGFPGDASSSGLVLVHERKSGHLTPNDLSYVVRVASELSAFAAGNPDLGIKRLDTHRSPVIGPRLIGTSADGQAQAVLTMVSLEGTYLSKKTRIAVDKILEWSEKDRPAPPPGLEFALTGSAVVGHDSNRAANESIQNTTYATVALVVVILLVVYRSPLLAMVPLVTIALSVFVSLRIIALLTTVPGLSFQVISITRVFVIVVLFGAGTDYCLFLIARYSEELARGRPRGDALREAIKQVGAALIASAGTVIVGLGMLYFSSFAKVRFTGPTIALSLGISLIAALSLAPAMLECLGRAIFWPFRAPHHVRGADRETESLEALPMTGFWVTVANVVVKHPLAIMSACLLVIVPMAVVGARTKSNHSQLADLDPDRISVVGAKVVKRYFDVGELGPASAFIETPRLDYRAAQGREAIAKLTERLRTIDNVADVRSLTSPLGNQRQPAASRGLLSSVSSWAVDRGAESRYVSVRGARETDRNHITRIDIVFKTDPFSPESMRTLDVVEDTIRAASADGQPLQGTTAIGFVGSTASVSDLKRVTTSDERKMYVLVTLGVYTILVILLRRPGICLYLIATVVLGYLASLGVTDLVFRTLHQSGTPWNGLDWTVGFFLFVILVAVGEDYNILLMTRVIEEERKHGTTEGTRRAVAHTGGIISSCGLIMAGTFGSMLTGSLASLRQLGFALALGILLDTFIVRPILVPAFVVLMDRARDRRLAAARQPATEAIVSQAS
jgi:putative drug exporter of the RND superfamily